MKWKYGWCITLVLYSLGCNAIEVADDAGRVIKLQKPAQRIITLAPHLTEMLYAIGMGDRIVATVQYSDYPEQARRIPHLGSFENVKLETILAYRPDLILAWDSGNNREQLAVMEKFGLTLYRDFPKKVEDVAHTLRNIGVLTASPQAEKVAGEFLAELQTLKQTYHGRQRIRVFYQFWDKPIYTINGQHFISDLLELCGLENVFADMLQLSTTVEREDILRANPDMIIAAGMQGAHVAWLQDWRRWPEITAVRYGNLFSINPDWLHRHTPRMLLAARQICGDAEQARKNLPRRIKKETRHTDGENRRRD